MQSFRAFAKHTIDDLATSIRFFPKDGGLVGRKYKLVRADDKTYYIEHKRTGELFADNIYSYRAGCAVIYRLEMQQDRTIIDVILDEDLKLHNALFDMRVFKTKAKTAGADTTDIYYARYLQAKDTVRRRATRLDKYVPHNII